jgi:RHS repeat-associated protein
MRVYRTQVNTAEPSVYAAYLYDAGGQRVKKLVRKQGGQIEVTVYIDGIFEYHRLVQGGKIQENDDLHVMDNQNRLALVRVGAAFPGDTTPPVKYHLSDHLGSSNVVVDSNGGWLNREEFTPYGETSFGSFARKRYRFTGKERDNESGLDYFGARYYAPWLGRWTSTDPLTVYALGADLNVYAYVSGRVLSVSDPAGLDDGGDGGGDDQSIIDQSDQNGGASQDGGIPVAGAPVGDIGNNSAQDNNTSDNTNATAPDTTSPVIYATPITIVGNATDANVDNMDQLQDPPKIVADNPTSNISKEPIATGSEFKSNRSLEKAIIQSNVDEEGIPQGSRARPQNIESAEHDAAVVATVNSFLENSQGNTLYEKLYNALSHLIEMRNESDLNSQSLILRDAERFLWGRTGVVELSKTMNPIIVKMFAPFGSVGYDIMKSVLLTFGGEDVIKTTRHPVSAVGGGRWFDLGIMYSEAFDAGKLDSPLSPTLLVNDPSYLLPYR